MHPKTISVGDFKKLLAMYPDDWRLSFGDGNLEFHKFKKRDEDFVNVEFNQLIRKHPDGKWTVDE